VEAKASRGDGHCAEAHGYHAKPTWLSFPVLVFFVNLYSEWNHLYERIHI